jgi:hypothetical protein
LLREPAAASNIAGLLCEGFCPAANQASKSTHPHQAFHNHPSL